MLLDKNVVNKANSVYKCDRCHAQLNNKTKVAIYISLPSRCPRKKWDLCKKCYNSLQRGIERNNQYV